jgi:hypothetical protein
MRNTTLPEGNAVCQWSRRAALPSLGSKVERHCRYKRGVGYAGRSAFCRIFCVYVWCSNPLFRRSGMWISYKQPSRQGRVPGGGRCHALWPRVAGRSRRCKAMNDHRESTRDQHVTGAPGPVGPVVVQQVYPRVQVQKATKVPRCTTCPVDDWRRWAVW